MGKLANQDLKKLLTCIRKDSRVVVPPMLGYDAGVHLLGEKYVVVATDPCIGVPSDWFGWLLINYAASDVALFGAKPEFCTITLLGPRDTKPRMFQGIMRQVCSAAYELNMTIVRGHTATYDDVASLVGVCTAYGTVEKKKLITSGDAKAGDLILCVKSIGLETLVNFSLTHKALAESLLGVEATKKLASMAKAQSCVKEALKLAGTEGVHAMHDATEGGFTAALNELAEAPNLGFKVHWENLPISAEARTLQDYFKLTDEQLLSMSSTGTFLVAVNPADRENIKNALREMSASASYVGEFTESKSRILVKNRKETRFPRTANDPYTLILSGKKQ